MKNFICLLRCILLIVISIPLIVIAGFEEVEE